VPFTEVELLQSLKAVTREALKTDAHSMQRYLIMRQGAELALGFQTALRGHDLAKLQVQDLTTTEGEPLLPKIHPTYNLSAGDKYCVRPNGVKNIQGMNAGHITVIEPRGRVETRVSSAALWVSMLLQTSIACNVPVTGFLFRPVNRRGTAVVDTAVSSSSINSDVKTVLRLGGVYRGQTAHSLRRSALIHAHQQGASTEELLDKALMTTAAVLKRRYLDGGRHVTTSQRAPKKWKARASVASST